MSEGRSNGVDSCDWISPRTGPKCSTGLGASGLCPFVSFKVLRVVRIWIPSTLFPLSPAELETAYFRLWTLIFKIEILWHVVLDKRKLASISG